LDSGATVLIMPVRAAHEFRCRQKLQFAVAFGTAGTLTGPSWSPASETGFPSVKAKRVGQHITPHGVSSRFSRFKKRRWTPGEFSAVLAHHTFATDFTEPTGNLKDAKGARSHNSQ
jgi:hypothetical protein